MPLAFRPLLAALLLSPVASAAWSPRVLTSHSTHNRALPLIPRPLLLPPRSCAARMFEAHETNLASRVIATEKLEARVFHCACALSVVLLFGRMLGNLVAALIGVVIGRTLLLAPTRRGSQAREAAHLMALGFERGRLLAKQAQDYVYDVALKHNIPGRVDSGIDRAAKCLEIVIQEIIELDRGAGVSSSVHAFWGRLNDRMQNFSWVSSVSQFTMQAWETSGFHKYTKEFENAVEERYLAEVSGV